MKGSRIIRNLLVLILAIVLSSLSCSVYAHTRHEVNFFEIIEHNGSVILLVDPLSGSIIHANQSASKFYGYSVIQLESMNISQITNLSLTEVKDLLEPALYKETSNFIMDHINANGDKRTVDVYVSPHEDEDEVILFATIYDITEKVELQKKNRIKNNTLIITLLSFSIITGVLCFVLHRNHRKLKEQTKRIEYLSYHDSLITGLYNRFYLEQELVQVDKPENLPLSVIIGDVNGLKLTNDIFGHEAGDMLLRKVAEIFKKVCSNDDIIARTGGDEFIILLPKKGYKEVEEIVNKINHLFSLESIRAIKASISMGWDTKSNENDDIHEIISNAEERMYEAKVLDSEKSKSSTIREIINTFYSYNPEEERHSRDVSRLCEETGKALQLSDMDIRRLKEAGYLHDIGKIVLNDELNKRYGDYTKEQKRFIRQHPIVSYRILNSFDETLDLAGLVLAHHEHWDGSGYPRGLKGQEIPLLARIISAAEYYDTILNKPGDTKDNKELAVNKLREQSGVKLDPRIVDVLCTIIEKESSNPSAANELPIMPVLN